MDLDPNTLVIMVVVTSLTAVAALAIVATGHRIAGLWSMAGALLCLALAFSIYRIHGAGMDPLAVATSNGALGLLGSLMLLAIVQLRSQRIHILWIVAPPLLAVAASLLLVQARPVRILITDAVSLGQGVVALWALLRAGGIGVGRGRHILAGSLVALIALFALRLVLVANGMLASGSGSVQTGTLDTLSYLFAYLIMVFTTMGFVLAAAEIMADQNHRLALQDVLTGLPNRRAMLDALSRHWYAAVRSERPLTLLMVDVDHFKLINDQYGHPAGDAVLRRLSRLMRSRLRAQDQVGRFGGEEFMVILPETAPDGAHALAETLRAEIAGHMLRFRGKSLTATVSIGMYTIWPTEADTIPEFIRRTDDALYRAKAAGRNRVTSA